MTVNKIILSPVGASHTDDSVIITATCGHEAYIAPSSLRVVNDPNVETETLCARCIDAKTLEAIRHQYQRLGGMLTAPGTREELNKELGVGEVDQMFTKFNVQEVHPNDLA